MILKIPKLKALNVLQEMQLTQLMRQKRPDDIIPVDLQNTKEFHRCTHPVGFQRLGAVLLPLLEAVAALGLVEDVGWKFSALCWPGHGSHGSRTHSSTMVGILFGHTANWRGPARAVGSLLVRPTPTGPWLSCRSRSARRCPAGGRCGTPSKTKVHWGRGAAALARKLLLLLWRRNGFGISQVGSELGTDTEPLRRGRSSLLPTTTHNYAPLPS